jgi:signal transduction histidine kinase
LTYITRRHRADADRRRYANLSGVHLRSGTLLLDGLLALALSAIGIAGTYGSLHATYGHTPQLPTWCAFVLSVVAASALAGRRTWPVATLAVATVATSAYLAAGFPYGPILLSLLVAVYTLARYVPTRRAVIVAAVALVVLLAHILVARPRPGVWGLVPGSAWVVVPFAIGLAVGLHREAVIRERTQLARAHADQERLRVAQEVHDVVGHGLSAITMQAEIALHLLDRQPEQAGPALSAISRTSREALDDLRVTLGLVRRGTGDDEARAPLPGLARLDELIARMSDSGVRVQIHTGGERRALSSAADLTAYRVVQESLTNVLRHAGAATADVWVNYLPDGLAVEVTDTGRGGPADVPPGDHSSRRGLDGMRERVTALGGTFHAGPRPTGGFGVSIRLPAS